MDKTSKYSRKDQILQALAHMLETAPGERVTTAALAREVGVSELWDLISTLDEPLELGQGNEKSQKTRLGKLLVKMRDRQFDNMRIVQAGERQRAKLWRLLNTTTKDPWD